MKKTKIEWNAILICEIVFGFIGAVFTFLGVVLNIFIADIAASPGSRGNVFILPWIFGAIGIAFLLVFAILFFITRKRMKIRGQLLENGDYIKACVTEVSQDVFVRVNNRHPYYLICEGVNPYTGERLTFKSGNLLKNPSHLLGRHLRVFIDYKKPENYYVEVERDFDD